MSPKPRNERQILQNTVIVLSFLLFVTVVLLIRIGEAGQEAAVKAAARVAEMHQPSIPKSRPADRP